MKESDLERRFRVLHWQKDHEENHRERLKGRAIGSQFEQRRSFASYVERLTDLFSNWVTGGTTNRLANDGTQNDLLQFILDKAKSNNDTVSTIAQRVLGLNFAAIHTTSVLFQTATHALTRLAEHPELLAPLRDEIEKSIAAEGGWTHAALANMWKLDSLLRETLRFHGIGLLEMGRKAMKDLTLRDGTFLPRGTIVHTAAHALHHDSAVLEHADVFDAFRYARMRTAGRGAGAKLQFSATTTSPEYLPFGHGAHACPGRYFADNVLKAVIAHLILKYDMKLGGDGVRPADVFIAMGVLPAPQSRVLFRPRKHGGDPGQ
ncbi:cytochrome P450 [Ganoderma sinense ZZ0214-1]|uniref:Cytochrome P450 n=1 Tax=Ganoderma sinense ZZ0214-1 TaxID=1077348 RepID=A0A2G8S901_9APHY|nr:cytochrome P450 [Ganoderma sinense ZZ0214-1]